MKKIKKKDKKKMREAKTETKWINQKRFDSRNPLNKKNKI